MTFHFKRDMRYPTPAKTKADRESRSSESVTRGPRLQRS